jgi:ABC-type glutathione transport system ATPase component
MGYPSITGVQYLNARSPKQTITMFNTRHIKKETNTQNTRNNNNKISLMFQKKITRLCPTNPIILIITQR